MIAKYTINEHLSKLREFIRHLGHYKKITERKKFLSEFMLQDMIERKQQMACEAVLTLAEMIIAEYGFKKPPEPKEIFPILEKEGVISKKLTPKLMDLASFRNVLVHHYIDLNSQKIWEHLQNDTPILEDFLRQVAKFVK